jgi:hypothetical protein
MKKIDEQVPTGREIEQRFVEQVYQAPSFVTLQIAEKLMRIRKTVGSKQTNLCALIFNPNSKGRKKEV